MRRSSAHSGDVRPFWSRPVNHTRTMQNMGGVPPSHDAVRMYLDSAVAEAAERWVGRATDATAYADLVAAVLARREALSPMVHLPEQVLAPPRPVRPDPSSRHHERRSRPRWPLGSPPPEVEAAAVAPPPHRPTSLAHPDAPARRSPDRPTADPPRRHRSLAADPAHPAGTAPRPRRRSTRSRSTSTTG